MNWKRVIGYGVAVWFVPFVASFALFVVHESNRALFESGMTVVAVISAVVFTLLYFAKVDRPDVSHGLALGLIWMAISIVLDLPIFLGIFQVTLANYLADIALGYLAMPALTAGIAIAQGRATSV